MITLKVFIFLFHCFLVHNDQNLASKYSRQNFLLNQTWIIYQTFAQNHHLCLKKCNEYIDCAFVKFNQSKCTMYSEYAKINSLGTDFAYNKILTTLPSCNNNQFWSLRNRECLPCPNGFIKYNQLPFACFKIDTNKTFSVAKSYCGQFGAHLLRPKTSYERKFLNSTFEYHEIWVDSSITSIEEVYYWDDGSLVGGFGPGQPNNQNNLINLIENCLSLRNGTLNDIPENFSRLTICQYD